jgi:hypothetical protein
MSAARSRRGFTPKAGYAHWRAFMVGPWTILIPDLWWDAIVGRMLALKPPKTLTA